MGTLVVFRDLMTMSSLFTTHAEADPRSFVGLKSDITWEFERRVCYYVGNTQAGKLAEVSEPNNSVIEGVYSDYQVESLFATGLTYTHFNEDRCRI